MKTVKIIKCDYTDKYYVEVEEPGSVRKVFYGIYSDCIIIEKAFIVVGYSNF